MNEKMQIFELDVNETIEKLMNGEIHPLTARINIITSAKLAFNAPAVSKSVRLEGRELLLAFCQWIENDQPIAFHNMGEFVNKFLSQQ
jgi:hypothetical protein